MNKNTIIGFVLIGLIMFGFSFYQSKQYQKQVEAQAQLDSIAMVEKVVETSAVAVKVENEKNVKVYKDSLLNEARTAQEQIVALSNDKMQVEFTTRGAQVYSVKLNDYMSYDSTALYLVKPQMSSYGVNLYVGEYINTKDFVFEVVEQTDSTVVMRMPFANGGYLQQKYALAAGTYNVSNELSVGGDVIPRNVSSLDIDWSLTIPCLEKGYKNEKQYSKVDYYFAGDEKPEQIGRGRDASERVNARFRWFAFQQQFFSAIMNAPQEFASSDDLSVKFYSEEEL